jgi:hypothetical protein
MTRPRARTIITKGDWVSTPRGVGQIARVYRTTFTITLPSDDGTYQQVNFPHDRVLWLGKTRPATMI